MVLSAAYADLAAKISTDLTAGEPSRANLGTEGVAFSWANGMPLTVASFVDSATISGLSVPVIHVAESGTPAGVVAEGGAKPQAIQLTTTTATLSKHAAQGTVTLERRQTAKNVIPAMLRTLASSLLMSFEAEAILALGNDAGSTVNGANNWLTNIVAAQAGVISQGGRPGLIILSGEDWATLVGELTTSAGLAINPSDQSAVGSLLGSQIHVSARVLPGQGFVLDPAAVCAFESEDGLLVVSDPYSKASTNEIVCTADLFASAYVVHPGLVVEVGVTP